MKKRLTEIKAIAEALKKESSPVANHSDKQSYNDCWRFLLDDLNELIDGPCFTKEDLRKAFEAGADKRNWTAIPFKNAVSGDDSMLHPVFDEWFKSQGNEA